MTKKIIIDTSGSMNEEGKSSVIKNILFVVDRFVADDESGDNFEVILLNEVSEIYSTGKPVQFKGNINSSNLKELLKQNDDTKIMFVTDGNLSAEVIKVLEKSECTISCVLLVGADANKAKIRKIIVTDNIYETTDLITCLEKL